MKDKLEKFIQENREEFDMLEPGDGIWEKIEKNIQPRKVINWRKVIWRAASVIIIFLASYMVHDYIDLKKQIFSHHESKNKKELMIPEIREAEVYYSNLINEKLKEIKPMLANNPGIEKEINIDLNQLDSSYVALKKDLKDNIANQEVIEAMIQNYRLRLSILEDVLSQLKPEKNDKNKKYNSYDM